MVSDERRAGARRNSRYEVARRSCRVDRSSRTGPYLIWQCSRARCTTLHTGLAAIRADADLYERWWLDRGRLHCVDGLARTLANRSGCAVLSVDYRLAPEHKFPAALNDVQSA